MLVADDEPLARERLRHLLGQVPAFGIVAECADGDDAWRAVLRHRPDVALLDITMPGLDGVALAQRLVDLPDPPTVVLITAHDEHALRAFEVSAVDYLVKPVDRERFERTMAHIERRLGGGGEAARAELRALVDELRATRGGTRRFVVRTARGHHFVRVEDVEAAVAEGNYVALLAGGRSHLVRETMKSLASRLDPATFVRVHRSAIVNLDHVMRIEALGHGEYRITTRSGARVESSRAYAGKLGELLR